MFRSLAASVVIICLLGIAESTDAEIVRLELIWSGNAGTTATGILSIDDALFAPNVTYLASSAWDGTLGPLEITFTGTNPDHVLVPVEGGNGDLFWETGGTGFAIPGVPVDFALIDVISDNHDVLDSDFRLQFENSDEDEDFTLTSIVPEPTTFALALLAALGVGITRWRGRTR